MKRLFAIPRFSDPEKQRRANMLLATQVASVVMAVSIVILSAILAPDHPEVIPQGIVGAVAIIISHIFLKKGKLEVAGWILVGLGWSILTLDLFLVSGIQGVNILGQVLIMMFAGLAISGRSALIITGINLAANLGVLYFEQSGILADPNPLPASMLRYSIQSIYTLLAATYIWRSDIVTKKAFKETQATSDRYRALFDRTNDGVLILDMNWCVLNYNLQAADMLGHDELDLIGQSISERLKGNGKVDGTDYLNDLLAESDLPTFESELNQKNGSVVPVEVSIAVVSDSLGDPHHIQCILRNITDRKEYERGLIFQALHDPLTNLPNRKYLEKQFQSINNRRVDDHYLVAVLFIDVDEFKAVNDQFGHQCGDLVLIELGARLQGSVRNSDTVARMGGDEFIIVLENIRSKENVITVAEKIISQISEPFLIQDHSISITASIGINFSEKSKMSDVDLIKTSDAALYKVKEDGKNNYKFFDSIVSA